jgi:hypothetical protein
MILYFKFDLRHLHVGASGVEEVLVRQIGGIYHKCGMPLNDRFEAVILAFHVVVGTDSSSVGLPRIRMPHVIVQL